MIKLEPTLSQFNIADISGLIELSASVGWDYDYEEIKTVLLSGRIYGHKNDDGQIISSAAVIDYDSTLASIGMVIVHPDYRGLGLGRLATQTCLDTISNKTSAMLIATEEGQPMYEKMGFKTIDNVSKFMCDSFLPCISDNHLLTIQSIQDEDLPQFFTFDLEAFGADRRIFLTNRIQQAKATIVVKDADGKIVGFALSILGPLNLIIGPVVASNDEIALLLTDHLAIRHSGKIRIDVTSENDVFMSQLEKRGFIKVSHPPIMIKNATQLPQRNGMLYALAAQVFG